MRAAAHLLAVLLLAAAGSAVAREKHLIDPTPPGSLNPELLPPLQNPDAPSTLAKELFARKSTPFPGPPRSIGGYFDGCLAGGVPLPITGPTWQVMRPSRNRNWIHNYDRPGRVPSQAGFCGARDLIHRDGRYICPVRNASCRIVAHRDTIRHAQPCHRARPLESRCRDRETCGFGD